MSRKLKKIPKLEQKMKKRLIVYIELIFLMFFLLVIRIGFIQFVSANELKESAYKQQVAVKTITPKRGNMYDSTGKALVLSADVDTVTVNPARLKKSDDSEVNKELLAGAFSNILEVDEISTLEKLKSDSSMVTIARKISNDKISILEAWLDENKITRGINIENDTRTFLSLWKFSFKLNRLYRNR
jgi:stage V sporulation protein D (sporulation-specific penicillin-binding protein)